MKGTEIMRHVVRHIGLVILSGILALALTACGPSASVADKQPQPVVRGESIAAAPQPKPAPVAPTTNLAPAPAPSRIAETPKPPPAKSAPATGDYSLIGFDKLASYNFEIDDAPFTNQPAADKANNQIPDRVKAFDQQKVSIKGFMLPLKVSEGVVTEFLIMKDQSMCCYGSVPKITEWVSVKTTGHGVKPIMDQPISILGTLHVGAMRENGYLIGIYQMDGDKLVTSDN